MVTSGRLVTDQVLAEASAYWTDQPLIVIDPWLGLNNSMKSFIKMELLLVPPPPSIWLMTRLVNVGFSGPGSADTAGSPVVARVGVGAASLMERPNVLSARLPARALPAGKPVASARRDRATIHKRIRRSLFDTISKS